MLTSVSLASDNSVSSLHAKTGDEVTLSITASKPINVPTVVFTDAGGNVVAAARVTVAGSAGDTSFSAAFAVESGDSDGSVTFSVDYTDSVGGNVGSTVSDVTDGTSVTIDNVPPIVEFAVRSDHTASQGTLASSLNLVILDIVPVSEEITAPSVVFTVGEVAIEQSRVDVDQLPSTGFLHHYAQFAVTIGDSDGPVRYTVDVTDRAGNVAEVNSDCASCLGAVEIDTTPPELEAVSIMPSPNPVGAGGIITLSFTASEPLSSSTNVTIEGKQVQLMCSTDRDCAGTLVVTAGMAPASPASFQISYSDLVGNAGPAESSTTDYTSVLIDTIPPVVTNIVLEAGSDHVGVGATITLTFDISEPITSVSVLIQDEVCASTGVGVKMALLRRPTV